MAKKRARVAQDLSHKSKKRQRVEATGDDGEIVGIDQLDWKEVALPDRLEDAEGFFGLEEIDGVDLVRPIGNGKIKFKAARNRMKKNVANSISSNTEHEDGEWSGISDDDEPADDKVHSGKGKQTNVDKIETKEDKEKKSKKQSKKDVKLMDAEIQSKKKPAPKHDIQSGISFEALEDEVDGDEVDVSRWDPLDISAEIQTSLSKLRFAKPTPIQTACIPLIASGHDVVGKASTGSGKTLAFGIPILEYYLKNRREEPVQHNDGELSSKYPIALILSPTRELAHQLSKHITALCTNAPNINARIALLTGGLSVQKQQRVLANADIVIGTPGRLWDVISTGHGLLRKFQNIKFLVIDEADRLLSEGHFKEVEEILTALDRKEIHDKVTADSESEDDASKVSPRQTLVFSATFHKGLQQKLAGKGRYFDGDLLDDKQSMEYLLKKLNFREDRPKFIDVNPVAQMAENLKEGLVECPAMEKDLYLYTLMLYHPQHRTLVFTNSISAVRRLTVFLQNLNLPALALHSSMAQKARLRSVERFSSPTADPSSILVATDVAARGLDIKGIDLIIHYHVPRTADTYVHRSGRTARASASGKSILLCAPEEIVGVARLAAKVHASSTTSSSSSVTKRLPLHSVDLDRRVIARVRHRVALAKKITNHTLAKEKLSSENDWLRSAADDLGVDYDSEEFAEQAKGKGRGRGRGGGREAREKAAGSMTKAEVAALKAQLRELLGKRINMGVSERYLTAGRVDIEALLAGGDNKAFLGQVGELDF
ncbi:ATP-dependent RNA helicase MAK5 [Histoplasma capsulatum var. duboisii H88]|uniref:ATP-dependent RNA helicase n=1 Tax=Ajellomyces capsulatus (strain H88) TaxID=544711 RepID=F0UTV3_AJEC8|nr:ATP-dependent RNA helicase MAK5 [Histoplasma capsulatum var. duboisii H88]QSS57842.1 ATP-dependent RNA helicase MAK5 [Histoplasma capsulatum var. duboisii H88]